MNRFIYIILVLVFGCFILAGSGYFQPTAMTSSIDKQSSENSNKSPATEKPNQKDYQNNNQNSDNSSTSPDETNKPINLNRQHRITKKTMRLLSPEIRMITPIIESK